MHVLETLDLSEALWIDTSNLLNTKLIVAATMSGRTARLISNLRPRSLILANTPSEKVARGLALNSGVYPVITKEYESTDEIVEDAIVRAKEFTDIKENDLLIITGGFPNNAEEKTTLTNTAYEGSVETTKTKKGHFRALYIVKKKFR